MALVTQNITPVRLFSPFEGMSEAQRLVTSVPRGMVRFFSDEALDAKPINDDLVVNITGSLPPAFAYVLSSLSYQLTDDRAEDFTAVTRFRIFNGLPNGIPGNEQVATFNLTSFAPGALISTPQRFLDFSLGSVREWFPQPLVRTQGATGISFTLQLGNGNNTAAAAGTQFFNCAFYQYELNQAVRFPLNSPFPVGIR